MTVDAGDNSTESELPGAALPTSDRGKADQQQQQHQQQQQQQQQQHQQTPQGQQSQEEEESLVLPGSRSSLCRICHASSWTKEPLISPCRCKGTQAHVHLTCLERWLNQSCRNYCELCRFRYNALETPCYGCFESLRIWVNHPRNRQYISRDLLIFGLLTLFTAGLLSVCLLGSRYFVLEGVRAGFSETWTRGSLLVFMAVVVLGYSASVYLLIRNQVTPWYRWWRGCVNVQLLLEPANNPTELQPLDEVAYSHDFAGDEHR